MNKDVLKIILAQCLSRFGDNIEYIALCLLCYKITGSVIPVGIVGILSALPNILFTLIGGALSEYREKKKIMIICEIARGFFILLVPLLSFLNRVEVIYLVTFLVSIVESFFEPCCTSYLSCSVNEDEYTKLSSISNSLYQAISIIGLAFGGILIGFIGEYNAFILDAVTFFASASIIGTIKKCKVEEIQTKNKNIICDIREGITCLWKNTGIKVYLLLLFIVSILVSPLEPYITEVMNNIENSDYGIGIMFAILSIGVIIGNLVLMYFQKFIKSNNKMITLMIIIGISGVILLMQKNLVVLGIGILVLGIVSGCLRTISVSSIMTSVEKQFRARTSSVILLVVLCLAPLGTMLASVLIEFDMMILFWLMELVLLGIFIYNYYKIRDKLK